MSHQKQNTFNQLLDYFNEEEEDEEEEEELINFEQKNNNFNNLKAKIPYYNNNKIEKFDNNNNDNNQKIDKIDNDINGSINDKQKQIFTELYSNIENNDENIFDCEQRFLPQNNNNNINNNNNNIGEDFNKLKVVSFRQYKFNENDENNLNSNTDNQKENDNDKIIEKIKTNNWLINSNNNNENINENKNEKNDKQSQKEIVYNKIIANQCSFGNINETSNRSTSINTDKNGISEYSQSKLFQDNFDQELYKPEYLINSKCFDELENSNNNKNKNNTENNNNNKNTNFSKKESIIDTNIYTFKQNENDFIKNRELVKKEINQLKNSILKHSSKKSKSKSKEKKIINKKNVNVHKNINNVGCKNKRPIELVLYDDAVKKRQKMENLYKNNLSKIQLNSTKNKINATSYKIALEHNDKIIEQIINKYSKNGEVLTLINIAQIFQDLKIFRKLLENININKLLNINNMIDFKNIIGIVIKEGDVRKNEELEFLEQTCNILNFEPKNYIRKDIIEGLLKILFASTGNVGNVNDIVYILKQYLQAALLGEGILELNNRNKKDDGLVLKNYIKKFFKLKENIIAYQNINNYNSKKYEKIIKERNDNLTFEPNIPQNENFHTNITQRRKNFNFNSLYNRFIQKEKNKQTNLEQLRRNKMREELKELKQKPTINKHIDNNSFYNDNNYYTLNIHDKLYRMNEHILQKKQQKIEEKKREDQEKYENECKSFKLHLNSRENRKRMAKSFDKKIKPKGYDDYIIRNKKAILERERIKTIMEKIPCGENYEKIKRRAITPFNITDMKKKRKKNKKEKEDFFTLQIKIPNGQLRVLKIYMKNDPYKVADDFCKIYSIKESIKKKLINNIINCQKTYLNDKRREEIENEEELEEEEEIIDNKNEINGSYI